MGVCASTAPQEDRISYSMAIEKLTKSTNSAQALSGHRPTDPEDVELLNTLGSHSMEGTSTDLAEALRTNEKYKGLIDMICTNGGTPLVLASYRGDVQCCKLLVDHGAGLDALCLQGTSPLFTAAQQNNLKVVDYLVTQGATVDLINKEGDEDVTALHAAAHHGRREIVDFLIAKGADPARGKLGGATPLWLAAQEGRLDVVRGLHEKHKQNANCLREDGKSALFIAAQRGQDAVVEYLIMKAEVPIQAVEDSGLTPLHAAAMFGHASTCDLICRLLPPDLLYEFVNAETNHGYTAVELREAHARDAPEGVHAILIEYQAEDRPPAKDEEKLVEVGYKARTMEDAIYVR